MQQKSPMREYSVSCNKLDLPLPLTITIETDANALDPRLHKEVAQALWFSFCANLPTDTVMVVWERSYGQPVDWIGERIEFDLKA